MSTAFPIPRYTYSDYERWEGDWELIGGYPYAMSPAPFNKHQVLAKNFIYAIEHQLRNQRKKNCNCSLLHEFDWIISEETVVRPDVAIICDKIERNDFIRVPPVLIIEIFSASTRLKDRNIKFKLYQDYGVKFYLMADPDLKKIEIFELTDNVYKETPGKADFILTAGCVVSINIEDVFTDV